MQQLFTAIDPSNWRYLARPTGGGVPG